MHQSQRMEKTGVWDRSNLFAWLGCYCREGEYWCWMKLRLQWTQQRIMLFRRRKEKKRVDVQSSLLFVGYQQSLTMIWFWFLMKVDTGKVIELDSPARLLTDNSSAFSKLVMEFLSRSLNTNHYWDLT